MTTLKEWRHIIANAVSVGLGNIDTGDKVPVYQTPFQGPVEMPCVTIWPAGLSEYYSLDTNDPGAAHSWLPTNFVVALVGGPASEKAYDLIDEWLDLLPAALDRCALDELFNDADTTPAISQVPAHVVDEVGGQGNYLMLPVEVQLIRQSHLT